MTNCRPEALGGAVTAYISAEHGFGTDALLLAHFAAPKRRDAACDLGSGCGIIPLLFCRDELCRSITAVEIQTDACSQIRKAIDENSLAEKLTVVQKDLRTLTQDDLPLYSFDLVTMNPPYKAPSSGLQSQTEPALLARHEVACTLDDVMRCGAKLLRFGGRLCICHRPERLADAICLMRANGIEPKRLRNVVHTSGRKPNLFLLEGKKGANSGMIVEPELVLKTDDGSYTDEALQWYGLYQNNLEG